MLEAPAALLYFRLSVPTVGAGAGIRHIVAVSQLPDGILSGTLFWIVHDNDPGIGSEMGPQPPCVKAVFGRAFNTDAAMAGLAAERGGLILKMAVSLPTDPSGGMDQRRTVDPEAVIVTIAAGGEVLDPVVGQIASCLCFAALEKVAGRDPDGGQALSLMEDAHRLGLFIHQQTVVLSGLDDLQVFDRHIALHIIGLALVPRANVSPLPVILKAYDLQRSDRAVHMSDRPAAYVRLFEDGFSGSLAAFIYHGRGDHHGPYRFI